MVKLHQQYIFLRRGKFGFRSVYFVLFEEVLFNYQQPVPIGKRFRY